MLQIQRAITTELINAARSYPVVTIIGPRQSGKTTLVKTTFPNKPYVSLENPDIRSFANTDPRRFLQQYPTGAIFDEIQRVPVLLSYIQGIVDEQEAVGLFILTGSHQLTLQAEINQSLAGRTSILHLLPLSLSELKQAELDLPLDQQLFYGFYPRIYKYNIDPSHFYRDYVQTYLERDVKLILNLKELDEFQRFLTLCSTRIGQLLDYTLMANDLGISRNTIKSWLSILKASFVITTLQPYFENLGKRIIKSPKLYFNDVGLACYLLGIRNASQIAHHPLRGNIFENLIVNEINKLHLNYGEIKSLYFYRDSNQLEVDLLFQHNTNLISIEIKSAITFNKNFLNNLLKFKQIATQYEVSSYLIYAGEHQQIIHDIQVINYENLSKIV